MPIMTVLNEYSGKMLLSQKSAAAAMLKPPFKVQKMPISPISMPTITNIPNNLCIKPPPFALYLYICLLFLNKYLEFFGVIFKKICYFSEKYCQNENFSVKYLNKLTIINLL